MIGTLCGGRRQAATTATATAAAAAVAVARIDWPPAAGWPAPCSRDALGNERNIKRAEETTPTAISTRAVTYYRTLYMTLCIRGRERARARRTVRNYYSPCTIASVFFCAAHV